MSSLVIEAILHWTAVGFYIVAMAILAHAVFFAHPERVRWGLWAAAVGLLPHTAGLVIRWVLSGHGPYILKYEVLSSNAWISVVMLLLVVWRRPGWALIGLIALPAAILMMGVGLFSNPEVRNLPPTLRSMWLVFHVLFNKLAVGAFILSAAAAGALLLKLKGATGGVLARLPDTPVMEAHMVRFVGFGFIFWSTTIVAGAIWANQSWGRYWGWDPIETWALVTWLCYGVLLHVRLFFRPKAAATAWFTLACFAVSILTIFIFPFLIPSLHSAYFQ